MISIQNSLFLFPFKIIGDHRRKSVKFEFGTHHYTAYSRNKNAFRESENWWFVHESDIKCKLKAPCIDKISANRTFYYFGDISGYIWVLKTKQQKVFHCLLLLCHSIYVYNNMMVS